MTGGQSFTWAFLLEQQGGNYTTLDFGLDSLGIGEELRVDFYENASDPQPELFRV